MTDSDATPSPRLCPTCGEEIGLRDKFCPMCGANLARATTWVAPAASTSQSEASEIAPLPTSQTQKKRRRKKKAPWYRRPLIMIPLVLLFLFGGVAGVLAWKTRSALEDVHSISTPPPEVDTAALGGEEGTTIDTGPALAALEARENRSTSNDSTTVEPTNESSTSGGSAANSATTTSQPLDSTMEATGTATQDENPTNATSLPVDTIPADSTTDSSTDALTIGSTGSPAAGTPATDGTPVPPGEEPTAEPTAPPVIASDGLTVLLMGVDSRDGEAIDIGVRPDSLAVLHIEEETGSCRILAVPRDSRAQLPGYGYSKINHALAVAGIPYEMLVIEEYLGLEIDNYALIDFSGLEAVVDSLGGITVENPAEFEINGEIFPAGTLELDGEQALLYSRFRGDNQGDFGRISRQQQVLRAMMSKATDLNVVTTLPSMFTMLSDHFRTDFGVGDLVDLANEYRTRCTASSIETQTIPGEVSMEYDELMQQELSFVVSDPAVVQQNVAWLLGETNEEPIDTPTMSTPVANIPGGSLRSSWVVRTRQPRQMFRIPATL